MALQTPTNDVRSPAVTQGRRGVLLAACFAKTSRRTFGCRVLQRLAGFLVTVVFLNGSRAAEADNDHVRLAFSSAMFTDVNEDDARASMKAWGQTVAKERHIPVELEPIIVKGIPAFQQALRNNAVDGVGITAVEYAALYKEVPFAPIFVTYNAGSVTVQYVLLVRQDSKIEGVADLRGRTLVLQGNVRNCLAQPWLDTLLIQQGFQPAANFMGKITSVAKLSNVVLPVFFHQSDACVTTRTGFDTMAELNPQVAKQLKILATSPAVVPAVLCYRADYAPAFKEALYAGLRDLDKSAAGLQVLTVFQSEKVEENPAAMNSALELLALHERLCGGMNSVKNNRADLPATNSVTAAAGIQNPHAHTP